MTIEDAIKTAIQLESKVHAVYAQAADKAIHAMARNLFKIFADEEQSHVTYLEHRLVEWRKDGCLSLERLKTNLPTREQIGFHQTIQPTKPILPSGTDQPDLDLLRHALLVENDTTAFYRKMVYELPAEGQSLFFRFLDIEDDHLAVVQAVMDSVNQSGTWLNLVELKSSG